MWQTHDEHVMWMFLFPHLLSASSNLNSSTWSESEVFVTDALSFEATLLLSISTSFSNLNIFSLERERERDRNINVHVHVYITLVQE